MAHYYFDANALLKYSALQNYQTEKGVDAIQQIVQTDNAIYYSSLTLLETWSVIFRCYRGNMFGKNKRKNNNTLRIIIERLEADLQRPPFVKIDTAMSENIVIQAHQFIEYYGTTKAVGSLDMLHIALVKFSVIESIIMVSSDKGVKNVCVSENIAVFDPEQQAT